MSPLLPIALVVGQTMSSKRLKDVGVCWYVLLQPQRLSASVYSLDPKRIAISGKIRVYCWDKTGTLTKSGLDFLGAQVTGLYQTGSNTSPSLRT